MGGSRGTLRVYRRVLIQVETTALGTDSAGETRRNLTRRQLPADAAAVSGPIRDFLSVKKNGRTDELKGSLEQIPGRLMPLAYPARILR
jgi:hypothetical protein